jgi:hypothetical protein
MLSDSDRTACGKQEFAQQSTPQKVFSAIWAVESEVNNGGFAQYFQNSSCETAGFVAETLNLIGAPKTAEICRRAVMAAFPKGLPSHSDAISAAAAAFPTDVEEELSQLDEAFFAYPHNLTELLFAYVPDHPDEFGPLA